jgi:hypothetical protein
MSNKDDIYRIYYATAAQMTLGSEPLLIRFHSKLEIVCVALARDAPTHNTKQTRD